VQHVDLRIAHVREMEGVQESVSGARGEIGRVQNMAYVQHELS
jgi:hypothetical protein